MIEAKVFSEVYAIINQLEENSVKKLPEKLLSELRENATIEVDYIDKSVPLEKLNLLNETKEILAVISYYYFCDDEERKKWDEVLSKNERKYQEILKEKYNPEDIFKKKEETSEKQNEEKKSDDKEVSLIEYKQNFIVRLINKLKEFFRKK